MSGPKDWLTPSACAAEYGIPIDIIGLHIQTGKIATGAVCGQLVVRRAEVAALALELRAGLCEGCDDA